MQERSSAMTMDNLDEQLAPDSNTKKSLRAWLYLMKCAKGMEQEMSDRFRESYNSSFSRFDVMAHLHHAGEKGISTSQLGGRLLASKGNITRLLDRMEKDGLVSRQTSSRDRRISNVSLSKKGVELFSQMAKEHEAWSHELFDVFSEEEKDLLVKLLKTVKSSMDNAVDS